MPPEARTAAPALAVVIPTLGRPTLLATVKSLCAAEGADQIEIIVVGKIRGSTVATEFATLCDACPWIRHLPVDYPRGDSSEKKNTGWRAAQSELVAFLDDDVVVAPDWPVRVLDAFKDPATELISGPGLVPPDAGLFARLAGVVLASPATGYVAWRYRQGESALVPVKWSKIIGCNMAFRKSILIENDGFDPAFWPGEEMIAAFRIERRGHQLKFYSPAWVYHYPRHTLRRFCRQIFGYGSTRIRLIRAGVSIEPSALVPAAGVLLLCLGLIGALFSHTLAWLLLVAAGLYGLIAFGVAVRMAIESRQPRDILCGFLIPVVHVCYGLASWWEFMRPNLDFGAHAQE